MRVTRSWLNEFLSLEGVSDEHLYEKLIGIGHEVASMERFSFDPLVVVGRVVTAEKHPDADKLSVCQVTVGEKLLTIVCGAPNVAAGQFVPVAQVGATLPGGLEIKEAELRGVASSGMICSAKELGLPALGEGILVLDKSIGDLTPGWQLNNYPALADTLFELELTANRGDCLSIFGVARDLSAALGQPLYPARADHFDQSAKGIGRILQLSTASGVSASVSIKAIENNGFELPLKVRLRLGWLESAHKESIDALCAYATHATGVLFRAYDIRAFCADPQQRGVARLKKEGGFNYLEGTAPLGRIGLESNRDLLATDGSELIVLEAFFVDPDEIAQAAWQEGLEGDDLHSRACKGSEPQLDFGMRFFYDLIAISGKSRFYSESLSHTPEYPERSISINSDRICALIGQAIDKNRIVSILKRLGAKVHVSGDQNSFALTPPLWRHDLKNSADIAEEVVRMLGIDQIVSQPLAFPEVRGATAGWHTFRHERTLAYRAVGQGFFESLHFLFCDGAAAAQFGFAPMDQALALANPITAELDALRPSLLVALVAAASRNLARGHTRALLFEIGDVYNAMRHHTREIAFVQSGPAQPPSVANHGKPAQPDLFSFARQLSAVIGSFELRTLAHPKPYMQPGQCAEAVLGGEVIGTIGKLHPQLAARYDLPATFVARFDMALLTPATPQAQLKPKLQPIWRDVSILLAKSHRFGVIKQAIRAESIGFLESMSAIDAYEDAQMAGKQSLTIRLKLQPEEKSLTDAQIQAVVDRVSSVLINRFGGEQR